MNTYFTQTRLCIPLLPFNIIILYFICIFSNIMDTSNFEKIEFDPHSEDVELKVTDHTGGEWIDGF